MNKVLFVAPTKYNYPIKEDLKSKFVILSEICKPFVFAFSNKKKTTAVGNTNLIPVSYTHLTLPTILRV